MTMGGCLRRRGVHLHEVKKSERIAGFVTGLGSLGRSPSVDPCLAGYFECFNSGRYYEAHDVLEHLWLRQGKDHPDHAFHKGLIQLAGAFVHLKLQHLHPDHQKHGRRLHPARRLFLLAITNLEGFAPRHLEVDVPAAIALARIFVTRIEERDFCRNPWEADNPPRLPFC